MPAKLGRIRSKVPDRRAEALQAVLELPLPLRLETRADLTQALAAYAPAPWPYVMLSTTRGKEIVREIGRGPRGGVTAQVWLACLAHAVYGTGEIAATRRELAELVGTTPEEVSRALSRLCQTHPPALVRSAPGKYELHPAVAWSGPLAAREQAAAGRLQGHLRAVD